MYILGARMAAMIAYQCCTGWTDEKVPATGTDSCEPLKIAGQRHLYLDRNIKRAVYGEWLNICTQLHPIVIPALFRATNLRLVDSRHRTHLCKIVDPINLRHVFDIHTKGKTKL